MLEVKEFEFPNDIRKKIENGVRKNVLKIEFNNGGEVLLKNTNLKIVKPHSIIFKDKKKKRYIIAYIVESDTAENGKSKFYLNYIHRTTKCTLTALINVVNDTFFPTPVKRS